LWAEPEASAEDVPARQGQTSRFNRDLRD